MRKLAAVLKTSAARAGAAAPFLAAAVGAFGGAASIAYGFEVLLRGLGFIVGGAIVLAAALVYGFGRLALDPAEKPE